MSLTQTRERYLVCVESNSGAAYLSITVDVTTMVFASSNFPVVNFEAFLPYGSTSPVDSGVSIP